MIAHLSSPFLARRCSRCVAAVLALLMSSALLLTPRAYAQIPPDLKAQTSLSESDRTVITTAVKTQAELLLKGTPTESAGARGILIDDLQASPLDAASPAVAEVFCTVLNDILEKELPKASIRARLNAAVVTCRAAERAGDYAWRLQPSALICLKDEAEPVALWGAKSGEFIIPAVLRVPALAGKPLMLEALPEVLQRHPSGDMFDEVSRALTGPRMEEHLTVALAMLHSMLESRVDFYRKGFPDLPEADIRGVNFLVSSAGWARQDAAQRRRSLQVALHLLHHTARLMGTQLQPAQQTELQRSLRLLGGALQVVGENQKFKPLSTAAARIREWRSGTTSDELRNQVAAVVKAAREMPDFAEVTDPAVAQAVAPGN